MEDYMIESLNTKCIKVPTLLSISHTNVFRPMKEVLLVKSTRRKASPKCFLKFKREKIFMGSAMKANSE